MLWGSEDINPNRIQVKGSTPPRPAGTKAGSKPENIRVDFDSVAAETPKAVCIELLDTTWWIPKSQIIDNGTDWVEIPEWLYVLKSKGE